MTVDAVQICSVSGCGGQHTAKGLCLIHYMRQKRTGTTELAAPRPPKNRRCSVTGCDGKHLAKGYCRLHYERVTKTGSPDARQIGGECSVDDCTTPIRARAMCRLHYERWKAQGDPLISLHERTPEQRFWGLVERRESDVCWLWQGTIDSHGYGAMTIRKRQYRAHRLAYEFVVGPIPEGLTIDHLCMVRACVNPAHMEPVTAEENTRRAKAAARAGRVDL